MLKRLKHNQKGLGAIEIIIVMVVVGVLFTIVYGTYAGVKANSRNDSRVADIKNMQSYIELFYTQNMYYPSLKDMNTPSWRSANLASGFKTSYMQDPLWSIKSKLCSVDGQPIFLRKPVIGCFGYNPTNSGALCENNDTSCNQYALSAALERGGTYTKYQLD